ncbi:hypothetical protein HYU16_01440 [Candidatus Woesearchaeota archaeon]|nr:hypothetical protein [Candidatus Woesearchaeota archaeon]
MSEGEDGYGTGRRWKHEEDDDEWFEELLEDDEVSSSEAGFMIGYKKAEEEGFE